MDTAADRAAIAAAASTVPKVRAKATYWQISNPGDALVRFDNAAVDTSGFGYIVTWELMVALGQDLARAEAWIDANLPALLDALAAEVTVTLVSSVDLILAAGRVPALLIQATRPA